jgi:cobalamin biosynthesis protein CobD/CbiB
MSVTRLTCMNVVKKNKVYLFILAVLPVIIGLSFITINPHAFAFPANIIICFVSVYLSVLFGRLSESLRFFSGQKAVLTAFVCIILLMIVHWFVQSSSLLMVGFFFLRFI